MLKGSPTPNFCVRISKSSDFLLILPWISLTFNSLDLTCILITHVFLRDFTSTHYLPYSRKISRDSIFEDFA